MRKFVLIFLVLAVASCKMGKNYQGAELEIPDGYRFAEANDIPEEFLVNTDSLEPDTTIDYDWFAIFDDPVLDSLVVKALTYNQDLAIAGENIVQAQLALSNQKTEMLPEFSYQVGASRGNFQQIVLSEPQNLFTGFGTVDWELDFWGKFRRLNEAARADLMGTVEGYRAAQISLTSTVADLYFLLLEYEARLEISQQTVALRDSMLGIIELRFDKGIIPEIDVNQAEIQLAIAQTQVPVWRRAIAQTEHQLSVLTGQNPRSIEVGKPLTQQEFNADMPEGLPLDILSRRPDVLVAEQALVAQNALVGAAQANRLPSISLTGLIGVASNEIDGLGTNAPVWNVGASLLGPLFYFNRLKRVAEIEKSKRDQAQLAYERTVLEAYQEVEDVLIGIETLKDELIAREAHVTAATNAQRLSEARYSEGVTSYLEYLESQRQKFEAQLNFAGTKQQLLSSYAQLYRALGGGWRINE
ncbi:efflux transporter outer membrane subunit [Cryomorphaceae bacterium 1068]|nr:efflux transporter outer membrane subunit [Cryomorphaceae bacterium 1068]